MVAAGCAGGEPSVRDAGASDRAMADAPAEALRPAPPEAGTTDLPGVDAAPATLTMTLDGTPMTATSASGVIANHLKAVSGSFGDPVTDPRIIVNLGLNPVVGTADQSGGVKMSFTRQNTVWACDRHVAGSSCTVTLTELGARPGERVAGTFSGTLIKQSPDSAAMTVVISAGAFSVPR
jgi:hypothetical protein